MESTFSVTIQTIQQVPSRCSWCSGSALGTQVDVAAAGEPGAHAMPRVAATSPIP